MEETDTSVLRVVYDRLKEHGSWLFDGIFYGLNYDDLFDPYGYGFKRITTRQKLLMLKEYKYCGLTPEALAAVYWAFCKQEQKQDLYDDMGRALLEIIDSITSEDVSNLDIHNLTNWYRGEEENPKTIKVHFVIKNTLAAMSSKLHKQLINQKDLLIRKRLILMHYSLDNKEIKVVENNDPILDKIDEELLVRIETYDKNDEDKRAFSIEQLVWDLYEEISNQKIDDLLSWYNWYMDTESDSHPLEMIHVIRHALFDMSSYLRQLLIDQNDNQIRTRLVLIHNSMTNYKQKIIKNKDPVFDKVGEGLLSKVELLDKEDKKARHILLEELVEDLHDEFDPEYKRQKQEHAQRLVTCIEGLLVEELKTMNEFSSYNLENVVKARKKPKEWLYSKISWEIMREIDKIRPKSD